MKFILYLLSRMKKEKIIVLFTVLVDVIGFGIVIPILPFYLTEFGASAFTVTMLFSTFSFFSFLSSPFLGALSDRIGRRPVLLVSIFSTAIGWFVFASAKIIPILFLGRIIDGIAAGNFTTAQSYLVDLAKDEKERASNLGLIGATFGIGFMIGPLIGGALSTISHSFPFWFAGGLALLNGIVAIFMLPETNMNRNETRIKYNPLTPLLRAYQNTKLHPLFITWLIFSSAFVTSQTIFALFTQKAFGFSAFHTGLFFTGIGIIVALNQTVLLKRFWLHHFTEHQLELIMLLILSAATGLMATKNIYLFFLAIPLLGTGQAVIRVVVTSRAVGQVDPKAKGEITGILASLMTLSMVLGPIIAGKLFEQNESYPFILSSVVLATGFVLAKRNDVVKH